MEMNEKPAYWAVIPASVRYDAALPPSAKLLYAEISSLTGETGYCYATNLYFEKNFELSERTIIRLLRALQEKGYIAIEDDGGGTDTRKIYAGINPLGKVAATPDKNVTPPPDKNVTPPLTKMSPISRYNNNIPPITPQGGKASDWKPERFEGLWQFYPHTPNDRKSRARKAWNRLKPDDHTIDLIAVALKLEMANNSEWQRGIGIPHLSTYLNGEYWRDALQRRHEMAAGEGQPSSGWAEDPEEV